MSSPIDPDKLLRQARALAGIGAGRGRPSPTNHRRAVSAAYYALFHSLCLHAAEYMLPATAPPDEAHRATRWFNHKDIRGVCEIVADCAAVTTPVSGRPKKVGLSAEPLWLALSSPSGAGRVSVVPPELAFVVDAFLTLRNARHAADYDHLAAFPKATTAGHVKDAEEAVSILKARAADPIFQRFFAWIVARATGFNRQR